LFINGCSSEEENTTQKIDLKSRKNVEARSDNYSLNEKIIENYYGSSFTFGTETFLR